VKQCKERNEAHGALKIRHKNCWAFQEGEEGREGMRFVYRGELDLEEEYREVGGRGHTTDIQLSHTDITDLQTIQLF